MFAQKFSFMSTPNSPNVAFESLSNATFDAKAGRLRRLLALLDAVWVGSGSGCALPLAIIPACWNQQKSELAQSEMLTSANLVGGRDGAQIELLRQSVFSNHPVTGWSLLRLRPPRRNLMVVVGRSRSGREGKAPSHRALTQTEGF